MKWPVLLLLTGSLFAGDAPRLFYSKAFPGSMPAYVQITLEKTGEVEYKEAPDDDNPLKYKMTGAEAGEVFGLAEKLGASVGMPGLGEKHVCEINGEKVTIPELNKLGLVEYIEPIELTNDNLNILTNKEDYFLLIDERITTFQNGNFYLKDKPIPIDIAYSVGGIHIIKKTELE